MGSPCARVGRKRGQRPSKAEMVPFEETDSRTLFAGTARQCLPRFNPPIWKHRFFSFLLLQIFLVILILLFINMSFDTSKQQELTGLAIGEPPFCDLIWSRIFYLRLHLMIFDRACHCPPLPPSPTRPHPVIRGHRLRIMGKPTVPRSSYDWFRSRRPVPWQAGNWSSWTIGWWWYIICPPSTLASNLLKFVRWDFCPKPHWPKVDSWGCSPISLARGPLTAAGPIWGCWALCNDSLIINVRASLAPEPSWRPL